MNFIEMIEAAADRCGEQKLLAERMGISPNSLTDAKRGSRPLKETACAVLAEVLDLDYGTVRKAHNEAYAKTEEERQLWKKVACIAVAGLISGAPLPPESQAAQGLANMTNELNVYYVK